MTIRRINSTGRRPIFEEQAKFRVLEEAPAPVVELDLDLSRLSLPPEALVFVEAKRKTTFDRFAWGTAANPRPQVPAVLKKFGSLAGVRFRVKVVSHGDPGGKLLAELDGVQLRGPEAKKQEGESLLSVKPADLGQRAWRVDIAEVEGPVLEVNQRLGNHLDVARTPQFISYALPAAVSEVLHYIVFVLKTRTTERDGGWPALWLRELPKIAGFKSLPKTDGDEDGGELVEWIDKLITSLCNKQGQFCKIFEQSEED